MNINYALVSAFERSKDNRKFKPTTHVFTIVLLAVFFVALMGGLAAGVSAYQKVANTQMDTNAVRMGSGLLTNIVRANDTADAVQEGAGPEGRALVLCEHLDSGDYEMRIYLNEGHIVQEYSVAGTEYTPGRAQELVASDTFDFELRGKLLTVTTDQGTFEVALRSDQGGAA